MLTSITSCGAELIGERFAAAEPASALPFADVVLASPAGLAAAFVAFFGRVARAGFFATAFGSASSDAAASLAAALAILGLRARAGFFATGFAVSLPASSLPAFSLPASTLCFAGFFAAFLRVVLRAALLSFTASPSFEVADAAFAASGAASVAGVLSAGDVSASDGSI